MKLEQLMTVATFSDSGPAERLRERLEKAGVPAQLFDEGLTQRLMWLVPSPKAHMRVRVDKGNTERAEALIRQWDAESNVLHEAICCPECRASRVEYPQYSRRTLMTMAFGFLNLIGYLPRLFYCRACHQTWSPDPPKPEPELDVLNWPIRHRRPVEVPARLRRR